jgi:hypothetical protein
MRLHFKSDRAARTFSAKRLRPTIAFLGETAATFEAAKLLATVISGSQLRFMSNTDALAQWMLEGDESGSRDIRDRVIICDHVVAEVVVKAIAKDDEADGDVPVSLVYAQIGTQ